MKITRRCPMCGKTNTIKVAEKISKAIKRYQTGNGYLQDIKLPESEREFIDTGLCIPCQEKKLNKVS